MPGGLAECREECGPIVEFFGLDPMILVAASEGAPTSHAPDERRHFDGAWVDALSERESKQLLRKLLAEDAAAVKAEMIAAIRDHAPSTDCRRSVKPSTTPLVPPRGTSADTPLNAHFAQNLPASSECLLRQNTPKMHDLNVNGNPGVVWGEPARTRSAVD